MLMAAVLTGFRKALDAAKINIQVKKVSMV